MGGRFLRFGELLGCLVQGEGRQDHRVVKHRTRVYKSRDNAKGDRRVGMGRRLVESQ